MDSKEAHRLIQKEVFGKEPGCLLIAEIAQAHDGSLGMAHSYIDAVAGTGAHCVKFQTHIAHAESSSEDEWRTNFSYEDNTRFEYWKRMEFTEEQWKGLKDHAEEKGLIFLSSAFSLQAIDLLDRIGMDAWKIASGEVNNYLALDRILETKKPVFLSSGMSAPEELERAIKRIESAKSPLAIMQCTTAYPCPPEAVGLNVMCDFMNTHNLPTGLSDHSATLFPSLAAVALGARLIEVHVTMSRHMFGPDVNASLTIDELGQLSDGIDSIVRMHNSPVDKAAQAGSLDPMRRLFNQGLVVEQDAPKGTKLERKHLGTRKPLAGIPASEYENVIGKSLNTDLSAGSFIKEEHLLSES